MGGAVQKKNRLLEIFFRVIRGEYISVRELSNEYGVSTKSISRDIGEIKNFLSDNRDLVGNTELKYLYNSKKHYLELDDFLLSKELIAIIKVLIASRALSKTEMIEIVSKLKSFTTRADQQVFNKLINKELYHYNEVKHDCNSVIDNIWQLTGCIDNRVEISITYYRMDRKYVERKVKPIAIIFSEYYYYLIAYMSSDENYKPLYFRVDRITNIVEHRKNFELKKEHSFDEGELRNKIHFMFPGEYRKIKFEYTGPSLQAILDRIPTARVVGKEGNKHLVEAMTYGTGINMYLLSQGSTVKPLAPEEFVEEMKNEVEKMRKLYE